MRKHSGYFTFFLVVTVIATLNDYWQVLRLDVLLADPEPAKEKSDDADNEETAPTTDDGDDAAGTPNNDAEEDGEHDEQDEKKKSIDVTDEADDSGRKCDTCNGDHGIHHPRLSRSTYLSI